MKTGAVLVVGIALLVFPLVMLPLVMAQQPEMRTVPMQGGDAAKYGQVSMQISCLPDARVPFQQGLALMHSFWFEASRKAFQDASTLDPSCAMAYWGEAMSYYDSLHQPPAASAVQSARQALQKAWFAGIRTEKERAFVAAAEALFVNFPKPSRLERDTAYSQMLEKIHAEYPDDSEAAAFYALSLLALARRGAPNASRLQMRAAEILEPLFKTLPDHPGVPHYLIHAYDDSGQRSRGIAAAERYAKIAPAVTHALHMPSHIFAGVGAWDATIASNEAALETLPSYYHALAYLVYARLQKGQFQQARELVEAHREKALAKEDNRAERTALQDLDVWLRLETRRWEEAAEESSYFDGPLEKAAALYVRGIGAARSGRPEEAARALEELRGIAVRLAANGDPAIAALGRMANVRALQVEAAILQALDNGAQAVTVLLQACQIEDAPDMIVAPPDSGTALPSHEVLGELLLEMERPQEALREFETALRGAPGRMRSLHGLAKAAAAAGNRPAAETYYRALLEHLSQADVDLPELAETRQYLMTSE